MLRRLLIVGLLLSAPNVSLAGIRGPGEYSGMVLFDRWDTCYLYDGMYLMYISTALKQTLRKHEGRQITLDATRVSQPMNPGDGLIQDFRSVRPADATEPLRVKFLIRPKLFATGPEFLMEIRNTGSAKVILRKWHIAPTVFTKMSGGKHVFSPSDGQSEACITRLALPYADGGRDESWEEQPTASGVVKTNHKWYGLAVDNGTVAWDCLTLEPGQSHTFDAVFSLSPGDYDFLFGYAASATISNIMSFSVDRFGGVRILANRRVGEH